MRYLGGKSRLAKPLSVFLNQRRRLGQVYREPFVGAANVFAMMTNPKVGSDVVPELIELLRDVSEGWEPPTHITVDDYRKAKEGLITDGLRAFIGFGCSFGGKWFGGYAKSPGRNYAMNARNSLLKRREGLQGAEFLVADYLDLNVKGELIYCDPPYQCTTKPGSRSIFSHDQFWEHTRYLSKTNDVYVSELVAPDDFHVVWEQQVKTDMQSHSKKTRIEKLFKHTPR